MILKELDASVEYVSTYYVDNRKELAIINLPDL